MPTEQRLKLDDKATPCIFVGYEDVEFGYRLYDSKRKKIIRNRDVIFYENQNLADFEKYENPRHAVESVTDLTPVSLPPDSATQGERCILIDMLMSQQWLMKMLSWGSILLHRYLRVEGLPGSIVHQLGILNQIIFC